MKIFSPKLIGILAIASLCSCVEDRLDEGVAGDQSSGQDKIIHTTYNAVKGEMLVQLSEEAVSNLEREASRAGATRSGIQPFDAALDEIHAVKFERVFPYVEETEANLRHHGLHRWYLVTFDEDVDLNSAAERLAEVGNDVSLVQFNGRVIKNFSEDVVSFNEVWGGAVPQIGTRADDAPFFDDPKLPLQWHYKNTGDETLVKPIKAGADINVEPAWELCAGNPNIIVAVCDQGVDPTHEDLASNMWVNEAELNGAPNTDNDGNGYKNDVYGYNFALDQGDLTWNQANDNAHGTHVAGTVAAVNHNLTGVSGVAGGSGNHDGVKIMSIQIFSRGYEASTAQVAKGIVYAANEGASILQCSWGVKSGAYTSDEQYEQTRGLEAQAFRYFNTEKTPARANSPIIDGGISIVSAGNNGRACSYPGAYAQVVCVTSLAADYTPSTFTNYGTPADIAAPGGDTFYYTYNASAGEVLSTVPAPDKYGYMSGTSMSAPHVSGVAALGLSYAYQLGKKFTAKEFRSMLLGAVDDLDPYLTGIKNYTPYSSDGFYQNGSMDMSTYKGKMGSGIVDAYKLLMSVRGTPAITVALNEPTTVALESYYGDITSTMSYVLNVSEEVKEKLGMTIEQVDGHTVKITCTKQSAGLGQIESAVGETDLSREVAIICRAKVASNGGWL